METLNLLLRFAGAGDCGAWSSCDLEGMLLGGSLGERKPGCGVMPMYTENAFISE